MYDRHVRRFTAWHDEGQRCRLLHCHAMPTKQACARCEQPRGTHSATVPPCSRQPCPEPCRQRGSYMVLGALLVQCCLWWQVVGCVASNPHWQPKCCCCCCRCSLRENCLHGCSQHAIALGSMYGAHLTAIHTPNQADETSRSRQSSSSAAHHGHVQGATAALLVARHGSVRAGARWCLVQRTNASAQGLLLSLINHPAGCCTKMRAAPLWKPVKRGEAGWWCT